MTDLMNFFFLTWCDSCTRFFFGILFFLLAAESSNQGSWLRVGAGLGWGVCFFFFSPLMTLSGTLLPRVMPWEGLVAGGLCGQDGGKQWRGRDKERNC